MEGIPSEEVVGTPTIIQGPPPGQEKHGPVMLYYLVSGVTVVTEVEYHSADVGQGMPIKWVYPTELNFTPMGSMLRPIFAQTDEVKFTPNDYILKHSVVFTMKADEKTTQSYFETVDMVRAKKAGIEKPQTGRRIIDPRNFKLPGPG